jgi:hypothetical protein
MASTLAFCSLGGPPPACWRSRRIVKSPPPPASSRLCIRPDSFGFCTYVQFQQLLNGLDMSVARLLELSFGDVPTFGEISPPREGFTSIIRLGWVDASSQNPAMSRLFMGAEQLVR